MKSPWSTKKLGEIIEEKKEKNKLNLNLPVYSVSNVHGFILSEEFFDKRVYSKSLRSYKIVEYGDFAYNPARVNVGSMGLFEKSKKGLVSPMYIVFRIKNKNCLLPKFLFLLLKTAKYFQIIKNTSESRGSVRKILSFKDLCNFQIPLPPLPIQQKIVSILDTIQSAIEVQEKIIEKTKELKKSMMNLLSRYGIKALKVKELLSSRVGELTSSEIEKLGIKLKKTEIGEIPEDWEVVRLGEVGVKIKAGGTPSTSEENYWNGKIAFTLTEVGLKNSASWIVPENSIILSLYATVGKPVINKIPVAITQNMLGVVPNKEVIETEFLYYALENSQNKLWRYTDLSVHKHITTSEAKKILIPLPPLPEQREIAEILQTIDQKIEIEQKKKALYEELFKTMLNKLMDSEIEVKNVEF